MDNQTWHVVNAESEEALITVTKPTWYRNRYTFSCRGHRYLIQKRGFFGATYKLTRNGRLRGHFDQVRRFSTSSQLKLEIILKTGEIKRYFMLKVPNRNLSLTSISSAFCIIKDEENESILEISGAMKLHSWSNMAYDIVITVLNREAAHLELLVYSKLMFDLIMSIDSEAT